MITQPYEKLPFERIFGHWINARILDHLITMKPFDYTVKELSEILHIRIETAKASILYLKKYGLVSESETYIGKYKLADNPRTLALSKFMHESAIYNFGVFDP